MNRSSARQKFVLYWLQCLSISSRSQATDGQLWFWSSMFVTLIASRVPRTHQKTAAGECRALPRMGNKFHPDFCSPFQPAGFQADVEAEQRRNECEPSQARSGINQSNYEHEARMCQTVVSKKHFSGCPTECDITTSTDVWCNQAQQRGTMCANAARSHLGQSTHSNQCPKHRDEGYSRR